VDTKVLNDRLTLIGNLGVVIGLAILIIEVNQANRLAETQAVAFRLDQMQHAQLAFSESDYLPQIELKYLAEGVQSLSALEIARLARWEESVMLRMESHYYHYQQGYIDRETGEQVLRAAARRLERWKALSVEINNKQFLRLVEEAAAN
jgi:hypothetical protein